MRAIANHSTYRVDILSSYGWYHGIILSLPIIYKSTGVDMYNTVYIFDYRND
jgi:hypothetical protein